MELNKKGIIQVDIDYFPITFSKGALNIIKKALSTKAYINKFLRISVIGGGCSGLRYGLNFINKIDKNDILCQYEVSINIIIDINSYICMKDTVIDFIKTPEKSGFIFNNPSSLSTCIGCT